MGRVEALAFLLFFLEANARAKDDDHIGYLTRNFFANLDANMNYVDLNETTYSFIDRQVSNYIDTIRRAHIGNVGDRKRRHIDFFRESSSGNNDVYVFEGFKALDVLETKFPLDVMLFNQMGQWYAVSLEHFENQRVAVYKSKDQKFEPLTSKKVRNGVRLGVQVTENGTFIAVAENGASSEGFENKTALYFFDLQENLAILQSFDVDYISDVALWESDEKTFMVLTTRTSTNLYKWLGHHFDMVQTLESFNATKAMPFKIRATQFLVVANYGADEGVYSGVYKYDLHTQKFMLHQKILTERAVDVKAFCFKLKHKTEQFLAIANQGGPSVVYKFVDNYFIPFQSFSENNISQWQPVVGPYGEFALLVLSKHEPMKVFQYDGWKFVEVQSQFSNLGKGVVAVNSYIFNDKPVIVVANEENSGDISSFYEVHFGRRDDLSEYYKTTLSWCRKSLVNAKSDGEKLARQKRDAGENEQSLHSKLKSQREELALLKSKLRELEDPTKITVVPGTIFAKTLTLTDDAYFDAILTKTLNDVDIFETLSNLVYLNGNQNLSTLTLKEAKFLGAKIGKVNDRSFGETLFTNNPLRLDVVDLDQLVIGGNLEVKGALNGVQISNSSVLLNELRQDFSGGLSVSGTLEARNLTATKLNDLSLDELDASSEHAANISSLATLTVKNLVVDGFVNEKYLPTIERYALRKVGDQVLTQNYIFRELHVEDVTSDGLVNGQKLPDLLVTVDGGDFNLDTQDFHFETLDVETLTVTSHLNQLKAKKGRFDVLLKNATEEQRMIGSKTFQNVQMLTPIKLQGRLVSKSIDKISPVVNVDKEVVVLQDCRIRGNVSVEDFLVGNNFVAGKSSRSLLDLFENGVGLKEAKIGVHLNFSQQLSVYHVTADSINGADPTSWVVAGKNDSQYIQGWKKFEGDVHVTGPTNLFEVNDVQVRKLESDVLKTVGDQVISGKHHIHSITTGSLTTATQKLGPLHWKDVVRRSSDDFMSGTVTVKSLTAKNLTCTNLVVEGSFNDLDFDSMLDDTVVHNSNKPILALKNFANLTVEELTSPKSLDMQRIPSLIAKSEATIGGLNVVDVVVERIHVGKRLNGVRAADLESNWLDGDEDRVIEEEQYFSEMHLTGENFVASGHINGVDLSNLFENSVKIDEEHSFGNVNFENVLISMESIDLEGHVENVDVDNIIADPSKELEIYDQVTFLEDVVFVGDVFTDGLLNGFNFTTLCEFANDNGTGNLLVEGNAGFGDEAEIKKINGYPLEEILETSWFVDREAEFTGDAYFQNLKFEGDVIVKGQVNDVDLKWLSDNYLSKTKNQIVVARMDFNDDVVFEEQLSAPEAKVGHLCDIKLDEFVSTAILNGVDQIFEEVLFVESCEIQRLEGEFSVNELNLQDDFMRYDGENIVTGKKTLRSLRSGSLNLIEGRKLQNVDIVQWMQNGVLKSGTHKIEGRLVFSNTTEFRNHTSLEGLLNGRPFNKETVMLKSEPQTVTGKKVFNGVARFADVKLKGLVNDVEFGELIHNLALKNEDLTLNGSMIFDTNLSANETYFAGLYQGVNVSELLYNISSYATLNSYNDNYDALYETALKVKDTLNLQLHYVNSFKIIQVFREVDEVFAVRNFYDSLYLAVFVTLNGTQTVDFFKWRQRQGDFAIDLGVSETVYYKDLSKALALEFDDQSYLYLEHYLYNDVNTRLGHIVLPEPDLKTNTFTVVGMIPNNGTKDVVPFVYPQSRKKCLLHVSDQISVFCYADRQLVLHQIFDIEDVVTAKTLTIDGEVYVAAISGANEVREACVSIWRSLENGLFAEVQRIFVFSPNGLSMIGYKSEYYIVIGSGHIWNTMYPGQIDIKRFDKTTRQFTTWQELRVSAPIQVELALLPSKELLLYVVCDNPTTPLVVYKYEGVAKFRPFVSMSSLSSCSSMTHSTTADNHYVVVDCGDEFKVLGAVFKGYNRT